MPTKTSGKNKSGATAVTKLIAALAEIHSVGEETPTKQDVGHRAGVDPASSTMRNACSSLRKEGLIETPGKSLIKLTQKGHDMARTMNIELPSSNSEFHSRFKATIQNHKGGKKSLEIFDFLASGPPRTKQEIAKAIGTDSSKSTFRNAMAPLNKLGYLEELPGRVFRLSDKCYPLGRDHGRSAAATA